MFQHGVISIQWHPTDPLIFSCSVDKTVRCDALCLCGFCVLCSFCDPASCIVRLRCRLWDARDGKNIRTWQGHGDTILTMAVNRCVTALCPSHPTLAG